MHFRKSHVRANKLDVQETDFSFAQLNRIRNHFLGNTTQNHDRTERPVVSTSEICSPPHTTHKRKQSRRVINDLDNVDCIPSNVQSSHQEGLLCVFEDNEAVIKMIMKGKKPHDETCFQNPQSCS